jgi:hypothetical protein
MPQTIKDDRLKMYILVRESVPLGVAIVNVAHASLACYRHFSYDELMQQWIAGPFYKVICQVSDKDFDACKKIEKHVIITENKYGDQEICIAFCPRWEWPRKFKYFRMYGGKKIEEWVRKHAHAPWTDQQVESINGFQKCDYNHPFTCGNCRNPLVAQSDGFVCPNQGCDYRQTWCHDFMANGAWEKHAQFMHRFIHGQGKSGSDI